MTAAKDLVDHYEVFLAVTRRMRQAAGASEWERLIDLERERREILEAIKPMDAATDLAGADRTRKHEIIGESLSLETEIRGLVEAWMAQLRLSIRSNAQEQRLLRQYGAT